MKNVITLLVLFLSLTINAQCIEGDCVNGQGTKVYKNGDRYQGLFKNGKRNGKGKFIWASGTLFDGTWVDNKREGDGQEILPDGTIFVGTFQNNLRNGTGTLYNKDKKVIKTGTWTNGTFDEKNPHNVTPVPPIPPKPIKSISPKIINLGLGLGNFYGLDTYSFTGASSSSIPPISISADFPLKNFNGWTLGGYFGYTSNKLTVRNEFFGDYGWKNSYYIIGARATYSSNLFNSKKTVPYGCLMLGINVARSSYFGDDSFGNSYSTAPGGFTPSGAIGLRHMFNVKTGAFAELGYGIAYLTAGISLKM